MTRCLLPDQATAAFEQWPDASVYNLDINGQYAPPSLRQARQRVSHCVFCRTILHHAMHRSLVRARSAPLTRHTVLMLRLCWQPGISRLLLVKHAADPNKRDEAGCTPLIFAAYAGFAKGVEMLLKKGAECDARDRLGHTALHSVASALDQVKTRWTKPAEDGSSPGYFTMYGHCLSAAITLGHSPFLPLPFFHFFRLGNPGSGTKRHGSGNQQRPRKEPLPPTSALRPSGTSPRKVTARRSSSTRGLRSC